MVLQGLLATVKEVRGEKKNTPHRPMTKYFWQGSFLLRHFGTRDDAFCAY